MIRDYKPIEMLPNFSASRLTEKIWKII